MTNAAQLPMLKNMLNSAYKTGFYMANFHVYLLANAANAEAVAATYGTKNFHDITIKKLEVILENSYLDKEILWVDNDIVFFKDIAPEILKTSGDFVIQDDIWGLCTGFFLMRCSTRTRNIIRKSIEYLKKSGDPKQNDQHAFNAVLPKSIPFVSVTKLPLTEYCNGHIYAVCNQKADAKMFHNNFLATTSEKVERFKSFGMWDESDTGFNNVYRYDMT
jgi:hypothetical protein